MYIVLFFFTFLYRYSQAIAMKKKIEVTYSRALVISIIEEVLSMGIFYSGVSNSIHFILFVFERAEQNRCLKTIPVVNYLSYFRMNMSMIYTPLISVSTTTKFSIVSNRRNSSSISSLAKKQPTFIRLTMY